MTRTQPDLHWLEPLCLLFSMVLSALALSGCEEDFDAYNELSSFRVMAIEPAPSWAAPGQTSQIRALVHTPEAESADIRYQWSWCPLPVEGSTRIECSISYDAFQALVTEIDDQFQVPDYTLGETSDVELPYPVPPQSVTEVCEALLESERPTLLLNPDCTFGLEVAIRLTASYQGASITTFKRVFLPASADTPLNNSPTLGAISAADLVLDAEQPTLLKAGTAYDLQAMIPEGAAENYIAESDDGEAEDTRETLSLTWFVEGGETEFIRTGYIPDENTLAEAGANTWTTPTQVGAELRLHVVIRDDRHGLSWSSRQVLLE